MWRGQARWGGCTSHCGIQEPTREGRVPRWDCTSWLPDSTAHPPGCQVLRSPPELVQGPAAPAGSLRTSASPSAAPGFLEGK